MEQDKWHPIAPAADVGERMQMCMVGRKRVVLVRIEGQVQAFDGMCPHVGGPLERGDLVGHTVTCPLHGWRFDLRKGGEETHGFACLRTFPVRQDGDQLLVQL
jgi:nitrite reductase (NADH) small subunit